MVTNIGLITMGGSAIINMFSQWLIIEQLPAPPEPPEPPAYMGQYRFLKDQYIVEDYISAGDIRQMFAPWAVIADVEPLDAVAVSSVYAAGPLLGGCIRTQFATGVMFPPTTYWKSVSPNLWGLTGLGANLAPISAIPQRIEDKEP